MNSHYPEKEAEDYLCSIDEMTDEIKRLNKELNKAIARAEKAEAREKQFYNIIKVVIRRGAWPVIMKIGLNEDQSFNRYEEACMYARTENIDALERALGITTVSK